VSPPAPTPTTTPASPFAGVVVFVHKKLEDQQQELWRAVETLGGQVCLFSTWIPSSGFLLFVGMRPFTT